MQTVLITGSNRGIGFAFTEHYLSLGYRVLATCRNPNTATALHALMQTYSDRCHVIALNVTEESSIKQLVDQITPLTERIDILIHNAGIYPSRTQGDTQQSRGQERLGTFVFELGLDVFRTNTLAPLMVTQVLLPFLKASKQAKIVSVSSGYGSISRNTTGFPYYYAASKAALNQVMRTLASDLKPMSIAVAVLDPGWVRTDMGGKEASLSPAQSAQGLIQAIEKLSITDTNRFVAWDGTQTPW